MPGLVNVARVDLAAFELLTLNVTAAGPLKDHVYLRLASPESSAPRTLRVVVVPVAGLGEAEATLETLGPPFKKNLNARSARAVVGDGTIAPNWPVPLTVMICGCAESGVEPLIHVSY